jgi:hypothetical protein
MSDRPTHTMIESNVRERQTCKRNLTGNFVSLEKNLEESFEKPHNFNKVSF